MNSIFAGLHRPFAISSKWPAAGAMNYCNVVPPLSLTLSLSLHVFIYFSVFLLLLGVSIILCARYFLYILCLLPFSSGAPTYNMLLRARFGERNSAVRLLFWFIWPLCNQEKPFMNTRESCRQSYDDLTIATAEWPSAVRLVRPHLLRWFAL